MRCLGISPVLPQDSPGLLWPGERSGRPAIHASCGRRIATSFRSLHSRRSGESHVRASMCASLFLLSYDRRCYPPGPGMVNSSLLDSILPSSVHIAPCASHPPVAGSTMATEAFEGGQFRPDRLNPPALRENRFPAHAAWGGAKRNAGAARLRRLLSCVTMMATPLAALVGAAVDAQLENL